MNPMTTSKTPAAATRFMTMESLALPQDLYWDGKVEPASPVFDTIELFPHLEPTTDILEDAIDLKDEDIQVAIELQDLLASEDCIIEICDLKTEPWSSNAKLQASSPVPQQQQQYIDFSIGSGLVHPNPVIKVTSPFTADSVFYAEAALTQLTPPQSPPQNAAASAPYQVFNEEAMHKEPLANLNIVESVLCAQEQQQQQQTSVAYPQWNGQQQLQPAVAAQDLMQDENLQIFEEIIKNAAKELPEWIDNCETQSSCSAPSQADSVMADDEWLPDSSSCSSSVASSPRHFGLASSGSSNIGSGSSSSDDQASGANTSEAAGKATKKRTRPYGRGVEDRKIRKKEQNKNAATRYRLKKKQEMATVQTEEQQLTKRNEELKRILAERTREAKYLKSLIREFYKDLL